MTIEELKKRVESLNKSIESNEKTYIEVESYDENGESSEELADVDARTQQMRQELLLTKELLAMKERTCEHCNAGDFEDGNIKGCCGGDDDFPIYRNEIRQCFMPIEHNSETSLAKIRGY